jgi:uncharacterized protein YdaT
MWTTTRFPAAMRSLNPSTRLKAIEIANQLLEQGQFEQSVIIAISVNEARRWARCSHMEREVTANQIRPFA